MTRMNRRNFIKQTSLAGVAAAVAVAAPRAHAEEPMTQAMPRIKLAHFEVSRLILGSNPFWGYAHQPGTDLEKQQKQFYTDERIMAVLDDAAARGITAVSVPPDKRWFGIWTRYKANGGKMADWISQPMPRPEGMKGDIDASVKNGAKAVYVQGHCVEEQFEGNTFDVVRGWVEYIRSCGVAAGIAAHRPDVHPEAQKRGFPVDFYFQCCYNVAHGDVYTEDDRRKAVETLRQLEKPVIMYKVLGAGRVSPKDGFEYVFPHLKAKDGMCVGVFPKDNPNQVREIADQAVRLSAK